MEMRLKISRGKLKLCLNHSHRLHPQPDVLDLWQRLQCIHQNLKPFLLAQSSTYVPASPENSCHPQLNIQLRKIRHQTSPHSRAQSQSPSLPTSLSSCLSVSLFYLLPKCFVVVVVVVVVQVTH